MPGGSSFTKSVDECKLHVHPVDGHHLTTLQARGIDPAYKGGPCGYGGRDWELDESKARG